MSWRVCHATAFEPEAYLVKGFLEHQGIPCLVESRRLGVDVLRSAGFTPIRILVPEEWVPIAAKLISRRTRRPARRQATVIAVDFRRRRRCAPRVPRREQGGQS